MHILLVFLLGFLVHRLLLHRKAGRRSGSTTSPAPMSQAEPSKLSSQDCTPDLPLSFGYKTAWLCIRADEPAQVIMALGGRDAEACSWRAGLSRAGTQRQVFVSPCLRGYILAIGLPELKSQILETLAVNFEEIQYFITHRVVDYQGWAKYQNGKCVRAYAWIGERGEVLWDEGSLTAEELALGGQDFPRQGKEEDAVRYPDEETVLSMAAAWGIATDLEAGDYPPSCGYLCKVQFS